MTAGFARRSWSVAKELNKPEAEDHRRAAGISLSCIHKAASSGCACAPVSLPRTVYGIFTQLLTVELVISQPAESNRDWTGPCAEPLRRTADAAAGL